MSARNPSIQGINAPSMGGSNYDYYSLGQAPTENVDASNPFYTTKVSNLTISATTYTAGVGDAAGTIVFTFSGSPDLSEVMVRNYLRVNECEDINNVGDFEITAIDNSAKTITVSSIRGLTNASSSGKAETLPFFGAYSIECFTDTSGLSVTEVGQDGAANGELTTGTGMVGEFTEVTISTSGFVRLKLY